MRKRQSRMTTTLVLPQALADEIEAVTRQPLETAGVLVARMAKVSEGEIRLLALKVLWVPQSSYLEREEASLSISSEGYVAALGYAERRGAVAIWLHTHPGFDGIPIPSRRDRRVDQQISDLFRMRTGSESYGTLIFSPREWGYAFAGGFSPSNGATEAIDRIWSVGDRLRLTLAFDAGVRLTLTRSLTGRCARLARQSSSH